MIFTVAAIFETILKYLIKENSRKFEDLRSFVYDRNVPYYQKPRLKILIPLIQLKNIIDFYFKV